MVNEGDKPPDWAKGDALMEWYVKEIWGKRIFDDNGLFEVMSLQVFQAGLTWKMILLRRDAFRKAFGGWEIDSVANLSSRDVENLMKDESIIRNKKKIEACITNARVVQGLQASHESFCRWFYDVLDGENLPALQRILRKTFSFVGPEIARMWLMAAGRIPET